ncbi:MAG TPA: hypothetical protein VIZ68_07575, partial [Thermoplasmata archaeon]
PYADRITCTPHRIVVRSESPEAFTTFLGRFFGPTVTALGRATPAQARELEAEMIALVRACNSLGGPDVLMPVEYLEVVAHRS